MERYLKMIIYITLSIVVLAMVGSYVAYSMYWPKDPEIEVDKTNLTYYYETYEECRSAFLESIETIAGGFEGVETGKFHVQSEIDDDLSIDWSYIPAQKSKEKLLILNSGLHGIEGFTGSAIQLMFIEKLMKQVPENMGVLFLHGLNPYGFKYHRKVTENNVDLNRNCLKANQLFNIENQGYVELTDLLMPTQPVNLGSRRNRFYHLTAIYKIMKESMPVLRQAALQGQYQFEKGFYYGGKDHEPLIKELSPFLIDKISGYKMVLNVDLHTGYGERGTLHLFIDRPEDPAVMHGIEQIFGGLKIDWAGSGDFYTIHGEYTGWVNHLVPEVLCIPMLFEFGTLNSQTTFGALKSMQIMILENQGAHHGYKSANDEAKTKYMFDELYYPSSPVWRAKVISEAYHAMSLMMENFKNFESTNR